MPSVELTPVKLAELKQKAEAASSHSEGRWGVIDHPHTGGWGLCIHDQGDIIARATGRDKKWKTSVFNHIAAADPATVLAMVDEIEILKTALNLLLWEYYSTNLLLWEYYSTDLEQEDIDKYCKKQIEMAKKYRESEAGQ